MDFCLKCGIFRLGLTFCVVCEMLLPRLASIRSSFWSWIWFSYWCYVMQ